ncbi:MAG TPA: hypothetical protein EYH05_05515, partial [Anaerolineae bacterium]|nr:hypothetical protein [Anaerolineae bacterium]
MTKTNYQKIREFHDALGETPASPVVPGADILQLRQTLIREEYEEVMAAFGEVTAVLRQGGTPDMTNLAHELADLLY